MTDAKFRAPDNSGGALGGLGEGLQHLGAAGAQYAEVQDHINAQMDEASAKQQLVQYSAFRNQQLYTGDKAFKSLSGQDALNARLPVQKSLDEKIGTLMGGLTSPRAKKLFTDAVGLERQRDGVDIGTHAVQQAKVYNDQQDTALQVQSSQDMISATLRGDAHAAEFAKGTLTNSINSQYDRNGLSGAPAETARAKALSAIHGSVIENMLAADHLDAAVKYHDENASGMLAADNLRAVEMLKDPLEKRDTDAYVNKVMGTATSGTTSSPFSYADPLHGIGRAPVPGGQFNADRDYGGHQGADLPAPVGSSVFATAPGRATVSTSKLGGNIVTIDHGGGVVSRYMHLGKVDVKDGDTVTPDTVIGAVGMTGRSTGPHLHFEIRENGKPVDPEATVGKVQQSPQRHDLNAILGRIDQDPSITPEQRIRYKAEAERRVGRDEQLQGRVEDDAQRQALDAIASLGGKKGGVGFTDMSQLPASVRASLSPSARLSFMTMAEENKKAALTGDTVKADGPDAFNLHRLAQYDRDSFMRLDLGMYQNKVTPGEMESLAHLQGEMRTKGPVATNNYDEIWSRIRSGAPDLGLRIGNRDRLSAAESKTATSDTAKAMRIYTAMDADLRAKTGGSRQATKDEVLDAYDRAVRMVVVNGDAAHPQRAYEVLSGNGTADFVPDVDRRQISDAYRRRYNRFPTEGDIARLYRMRHGQ